MGIPFRFFFIISTKTVSTIFKNLEFQFSNDKQINFGPQIGQNWGFSMFLDLDFGMKIQLFHPPRKNIQEHLWRKNSKFCQN